MNKDQIPEQIDKVGENAESEENAQGLSDTNRWRAWIAAAIVSVLAIALISVYLWKRLPHSAVAPKNEAEKSEGGKIKFLMEQQWLIKMKLAKVEEATVSRQITSVGRIIPAANSQASVSTPVAGILTSRELPRLGQPVKAGQTIAVISQTPTSAEQAQTRAAQSQVELSRAQLETQRRQMDIQNSQIQIENVRLEAEKRNAKGDLETARVRLEQAKREADRTQRLFDGNAASQKQLQTAQSDRDSAQVLYDSALRRNEALKEARPVKLESTKNNPDVAGSINASNVLTVTAPFGGYVTKVNKSIGEQVSPGEVIVEISNLETVYVEAPIFERDLNALGASKTATFSVSAYDQEFKGTVIDLGATIDENTRAANVIFQVENPGRALRLGMQANVRLDNEKTISAMMIPKEAVLEHEGKKIVYVLLSGEEFERREVTVGDEYGDRIAILSGLENGERVVTQGAYQLKLQELRPAEAGAHSHET